MLTHKQLELRKQGVGASEIGALLGVDPYKTAMAVWMDKFRAPDELDNHHIRRGNYLEDGLRQWASEEIGIEFKECETLRHPEHERIFATPDGISTEGVLEIKSPSPRNYWQWGEGEDVPDQYAAQLAQQMLVTGLPRGFLVVFLGDDLRVYSFEREEQLERVIIERINTFWRDHVETEEPPPADWSKEWNDYLAERFPEARAPRIEASAEADILAQEYLKIQQEFAIMNKRKEAIKNQMALICKDADGIDGYEWRLNYRKPKPSKRVDKNQAIAIADKARAACVISDDERNALMKEIETSRRFDLRRIK